MDAKIHLMKRTVIKTVEILFKILIKIVFCHWDKKGNLGILQLLVPAIMPSGGDYTIMF